MKWACVLVDHMTSPFQARMQSDVEVSGEKKAKRQKTIQQCFDKAS